MSKLFDKIAMQQFAVQLRSDEFREFWQSKASYNTSKYYTIMDNYIEESVFALTLLQELDIENKKVLEVGAGAGILTAWLLKNNVNVWGIEPSGIGYDFHNNMFEAVKEFYQLPDNRIIDAAAEDLNPKLINNVDIVFSLNVLEHIKPENLQQAFVGMKSVLAKGGKMLHHCPNYVIPFEPHYGLPLVPLFPHISGKLKGVYDESVWQSLNFITYFKTKKLASKTSLKITYKKGLMADAFIRLEKDEVYASRHKTLVRIYPLLKYSGIICLMKQIPPSLCTPMTFFLSE
jgi:SAM-dependent methyltransferase